jgi:flagellar capping protein FliD
MKSSSFKKISTTVLVVLILSIPVVGYIQRQAIFDWSRLHNYTPPDTVSQLASDDTMTDEATNIFYVTHPVVVADAATFRKDCPQNEQTIVLGCFTSMSRGQGLSINGPSIYLYNVSDDRLKGVVQVTAAHEMLHAAYERLSDRDKKYVNGLLENYYATQTDSRITKTINAYKKTEPNDVINEMHSIFGTEIADLPAPLESYYKQYFNNRKIVTDYSDQYENEFSSRIDKINAYDQQLRDMKASIDTQQDNLKQQLSKIQSDRRSLNTLRASGDIDTYNSQVDGFNAELRAYNDGIDKLQQQIDTYNSLIQTRNALAEELRGLDSALDTRLTPQTVEQ